MTPRLEPAQEAALKAAPLFRYTGIVTRFVAMRYRRSIISPIGAWSVGQRWNPRGVPALYTSVERLTACSEFTQNFDDNDAVGLCLMASIAVDNLRYVDLTTDAELGRLGTSVAAVTAPRDPGEVTDSVRIGGSTAALGIAALLVPSAAHPGGRNLVLFPENLKTLPLVVLRAARL